MSLKLINANTFKKTANFRFRPFDKQYLLTNDIGEYCFLDSKDFQSFISGDIELIPLSKFNELKDKHFLRDFLNLDRFTQLYGRRNAFLFAGPSLHIIVVTLRCDHSCIYCQANSKGIDERGWDMNEATAKCVVDIIFETPNSDVMIEFQGGEPLLNFEVVKFIVLYAKKKNINHGKKLKFSLVSNFTYMDTNKLNFLIKNEISLCTSLDGPEYLHNKNRISGYGDNTYQNTVKWIKLINKKRKRGEYAYKINALPTLTKLSLRYPIEIVDEFIGLDLEMIHLRPVNPFTVAKKRIRTPLFISIDEFNIFYKNALTYILKLNAKGRKIYERTAWIFLKKILCNTDPNYLDSRSPCGAGIGQLAYNFNGDVYACDEGRMLSAGSNDESFRLGNVFKNRLSDLIDHTTVKSICFASCLDNIPGCSDCVYKPYCGICPLYTYAAEGNLFIKSKEKSKCQTNSYILNILFKELQTPAIKIFKRWVGADNDKKI